MEIFNTQNFPWHKLAIVPIAKRKRGQRKKGEQCEYINIINAFDIETTRLADIEQSIMYIWQWHFSGIGTLIGRTWQEFLQALDNIDDICTMRSSPDHHVRLVTYVHNLSYEFSFLQGIYHFYDEDVFAVKSRKILKCVLRGCVEMRCSYIHSNMSLDLYCRKMGVQHKKLGGYDYDKIRYPWTPLTDAELQYCIHDVQGLCEALAVEMATDCDNLYSIPLTSTGYVRRDCKKAMHKYRTTVVADILPDWEIYQALREAFRGGNTHANRYYAGRIIHNVHSADRSSSYPDVICNCEFPMRFFQKITVNSIQDLKRLQQRHKALLMRVAFTNISLLDFFWGCPYLASAKCRRVEHGCYDNGRILSATYLETTITDIDLNIIISEYDFTSMVVIDCWAATYGKLPKDLRQTVIQYYVTKTALKGVKDGDSEIIYTKAKNKLNSIYGMMAQDPVKENVLYADAKWLMDESIAPKELLEKHNRGAFLSYAWGVWTTAWARYRLEEGIRLAGEGFIYADTDSVKYVGNINWDAYNTQRIADSDQSGAHATDAIGIEHYMGVYEPEADYASFSTLGAKKYAYVHNLGDNVEITIAGVNKKAGAKELQAAGGLSAFAPGFIFTEGGGLESVYNDHPDIGTITREGRTLEITSNVCLRPSTYKLGLTGEYERLLDTCGEWFNRKFSWQVET